jgi:pyruvate/2-oxoglutarate dehydrogenase complex dihydrolipoamide acyltransferase (E2) component
MATEVKIPGDLWSEDAEAVITSWLAGDGSQVSAGSLIAEIMVEKAQHEIKAPADGVLKIARQVDDIVAKGDVIGIIE